MTETKKYLIEQVCKMTMKCLEQTETVALDKVPATSVNITAVNNADKESVKEVTDAVTEMMTATPAGVYGVYLESIEADAEFRHNKTVQGIPFGGVKPRKSAPSLSEKPGRLLNEKSEGKNISEFVKELYTTLFELPDTDENEEEHVGRSPKVSVIDV